MIHVQIKFLKFHLHGQDSPYCTGQETTKFNVPALSSGTVTMPDGSVYDNVVLVESIQDCTEGQSRFAHQVTLNELQAWEWWAEGFATPLVRTSLSHNVASALQDPPRY